MSSLLDDLLDVSRITRGSFLLKKEYVDVQELMEDAVVAVAAGDRRQAPHAASRYPPTPIVLEVDPVRMTQVHHQSADQRRQVHARAADSFVWERALRPITWSSLCAITAWD